MQAMIIHPDPHKEISIPEGCEILECLNTPSDPDVSIARARVKIGVTTAWHWLRDTRERYLIQSGTGRVEVGDLAPTDVGPGDIVVIPAGMKQRISNTSQGDLVFYAICTPRFTPDCYNNLP